MKKLFIALAFMVGVASNTIQAQSFGFDWSPVFTIAYKGEENKKIVHASVDELIMLRRSDGTIFANYYYEVVKYGADLKEEYKVKITPKYGTTHDYQTLVDVVYSKGKVFVVYQHFVKEDGETKFEYCEISSKGKLSDITEIGTIKTEKSKDEPESSLAVSPDGTKFCLFAKLDHEKNGNEKWKVWIFDSGDTKELVAKDIELDIESEKSVYNEVFINNAGNVQVYKRWKVKKEGEKYAVFTLTPSGAFSNAPIDIGEREIADKKIFFNSEGLLTVCGLYNNKGKYWSPFAGTFLVTFDEAGAVKTNSVEYFGKMVLGLVFPKNSRADKEDVHIEGYKLRSVLEDENGELTVVIEKYDESTASIPGSTDAFARNYIRTHKNTIAIRLGKDGAKQWAQLFEKTQNYKTQDGYKFWGGTIDMVSNGAVYHIYNYTNLPNIAGPKGYNVPGWIDTKKQKHYKETEFGNRAHYATFVGGTSADGRQLFSDLGFENSAPLKDMYAGATYEVTFSSGFYARCDNVVYLIMEMADGAAKGATKWQICKVTLDME